MGRAFIGVEAFEITLRDETVLGIFLMTESIVS